MSCMEKIGGGRRDCRKWEGLENPGTQAEQQLQQQAREKTRVSRFSFSPVRKAEGCQIPSCSFKALEGEGLLAAAPKAASSSPSGSFLLRLGRVKLRRLHVDLISMGTSRQEAAPAILKCVVFSLQDPRVGIHFLLNKQQQPQLAIYLLAGLHFLSAS